MAGVDEEGADAAAPSSVRVVCLVCGAHLCDEARDVFGMDLKAGLSEIPVLAESESEWLSLMRVSDGGPRSSPQRWWWSLPGPWEFRPGGGENVLGCTAPGPVMGHDALVGAGPAERGSGVMVPEAAKRALVRSRGCRGLRDEVMGAAAAAVAAAADVSRVVWRSWCVAAAAAAAWRCESYRRVVVVPAAADAAAAAALEVASPVVIKCWSRCAASAAACALMVAVAAAAAAAAGLWQGS